MSMNICRVLDWGSCYFDGMCLCIENPLVGTVIVDVPDTVLLTVNGFQELSY